MSNDYDSTSETKWGLWVGFAALFLMFLACGGFFVFVWFGFESQAPPEHHSPIYKFFNPPPTKDR